jgi:hypothetical protein
MSRDPILDPSGAARALERLLGVVPGYTGYKARERLREEDRAIREAVARQLGVVVGRLERALALSVRALPAHDVEAASRALRALGRQRDRIRFAPAGYSSLFSRRQIRREDLDTLRVLDGSAWVVLEALDRIAATWDEEARRSRHAWPGEDVDRAVAELEDLLDERESLLRS